jgi:hypothetical protein
LIQSQRMGGRTSARVCDHCLATLTRPEAKGASHSSDDNSANESTGASTFGSHKPVGRRQHGGWRRLLHVSIGTDLRALSIVRLSTLSATPLERLIGSEAPSIGRCAGRLWHVGIRQTDRRWQKTGSPPSPLSQRSQDCRVPGGPILLGASGRYGAVS